MIHTPRPLRRVVVTGGAGFIGSHVCTHLRRQGIAVVSVDTYTTGCPTNLAHLADDAGFMAIHHDLVAPIEVQGPVDLVLHLASPALTDDGEPPGRRVLVGPHGTRTALEFAVGKHARFVFACSTAPACDDEMQGGEALTTAYRHVHGIQTAIARVFESYGPRMSAADRSPVPTLLRQAVAGEPVVVHGDGSQPRSVCYVDDVARGLVALAHSEEPGPMDFGDPFSHTTLDLAQAVVAATGSRSPVVFADDADAGYDGYDGPEPDARRPDIAHTRDALGWQPRVSWREGLHRTIAWMGAARSLHRLPA